MRDFALASIFAPWSLLMKNNMEQIGIYDSRLKPLDRPMRRHGDRYAYDSGYRDGFSKGFALCAGVVAVAVLMAYAVVAL
jgi:hypothetical protein